MPIAALWVFLLGAGIALFSPVSSAESPAADIRAGTQTVTLNSFAEHLEDRSGRLTFEDVLQPRVASGFTHNQKRGAFNVGFTSSAYWFRLSLHDSSGTTVPKTWFVQVGFPLLDYVDVYVPKDGGWANIQMGDQRPLTNRPVKHRNYVFPVELEPGQRITLYFRIQTKSAMVAPLSLSSPEALVSDTEGEITMLGGYYGIMVVLILFNVFTYLAVRDRSYVLYIFLVLFCGVLLSLTINGLGTEYLWGAWPRWVNASLPFFIGGTVFWAMAFTRTFLQTSRRFPRTNALLAVLQAIGCGGAVLAFILDYSTIIPVMLATTVVTAVVGAVATARALAAGMQAARIYLLAWVVLAIFAMLQIAQVINVLPAYWITSYIMQIGTAAALLLLSLAMADRLNIERKEAEGLVKERERAELDSQMKSQFLARMSHEIRTPMNAIIGFTDLAMRADKETKRLGFLSNIRSASQTLLHIINDILDLSKIEAGKLVIERRQFRLRTVLEKLGVLFSHTAAEKEIELILSIPPNLPSAVIGDPTRLEQVLVNLTANALKFTEKGGEVEIDVSQASVSEGRIVLRFAVRDTGIGLSTEQAARLFEPFSQADQSTTRRYGGTGLGLNISRQLVERMDGSIGVTSAPGAGSTFTVTLPFDVPKGSAVEKADLPDRFRGMRTLVVEDSATARRVHSMMLHSFGLKPETAVSGEEAVRKFAENPYQLVLMDWQMTGMDGLEAARIIRTHPKGETVPIIMISVHPRDELSQRMAPGLVNATLTKPISASDLFDTLMYLFDLSLDVGRMLPTLTSTPGAEKLKGARILLVEDNILNQRLAAEILRGLGMIVDVANDGAEGIAALNDNDYDAVLMDMQMPVMDGLEATRRIRERKEYEYLPIIAITANVMPQDSNRCIDAGMNDFIPKPVNPVHMIQVLGRWIGTPSGEVKQPAPPPPPPKAPPPSESSAPINIPEALERVGGNGKLLVEVLEIFRGHHAFDAQKFEIALSTGDGKAAHRLIHTLKGAAGNLAMPKLWASALELQRALENGGKVSEQQRNEFKIAFEAVLEALDPAIAEAKAAASRRAAGMH